MGGSLFQRVMYHLSGEKSSRNLFFFTHYALIVAALCAAVACLNIASCGEDSASPNHANTVKTSGRDTSSAPIQSAARPDLNDPEQRAELIKILSECFLFWESRDDIEIDENGKILTPTLDESLEEWRQANGLTKEDMTDLFARIIREHLTGLETASDTGPILWMEAMYFRAQIYLKHYPLPQKEFMALVRKTVDLDPDNAAGIVRSYIKTYPDWIFDDGTFVAIAERIHSSVMNDSTLLYDMYNQVGKETDEARKKKLVDKAFEWALRDDDLKNFHFLDRLLLDHDKKRYATHPGRKLQLEKELKLYEEARRYDWGYRRTKYALEHFGEGDEAVEMLYKMDTDLKLHDGEWERAERDKRLKEGFEEAEKRGIDLSTVLGPELYKKYQSFKASDKK